ncbi:RNA polymerase sigma-70 factor [Sphingobacterium bambusae]|uniref:RNA polymerase sigma-70 factor n=1 Tax=Sphingobacterium bambusae TaxID=662858 RepID=A0ABW6BEX7_9SPHI|nr:RNA polymerase sigma-70 factor [Sphingobacterium bambusae]WPL48790.1 RNA polymerase sigma-70 factor [Sphingobacterium bambusae]
MSSIINSVDDFEQLFSDHYSKLCAAADAVVKNEEEAEDLVQNFFIKVWTSRDTIKITFSFQAYAHKAIYLQALNHLRSKARAMELVDLQGAEELAGEYIDDASLIEKESAYKLLLDEIEVAISSLPAKSQQIFRMAHYQKMKHLLIADELGISVNTVKVQMSRAYKEIRKRLKTKDIPYFIIFFYPTLF